MTYLIEIIDERPPYGYRTVCAVLNGKLVEQGFDPVNHKRVYRIMREHGMLLKSHSMRHEVPVHTGKIVTAKSDQHWCGDGFELTRANGEKFRSIFHIV